MNQANWAVQFAKKLREEEILDLALDSLDLQNPPELLQESLRLIASTIFLPENRKIICRQACLEPIVNTFKETVYSQLSRGTFRRLFNSIWSPVGIAVKSGLTLFGPLPIIIEFNFGSKSGFKRDKAVRPPQGRVFPSVLSRNLGVLRERERRSHGSKSKLSADRMSANLIFF